MSTDKPDAARLPSVGLRLFIIIAAGLGVLTAACFCIISETEHAIVLRFGRPERILSEPGLYLRFPVPVERVIRLDRRLQHADIRLSETLTRDQRNVIVPVLFTWKIADPLLFHTAVKDIASARAKLDAVVTSARNSVLGRHDFADLLAVSGQENRLEKLEAEMRDLAATDARAQLGIELIATGITQIQLPEANTESVFRRMRAERKREATQYRAEGRAKAAEMKAATDREAAKMIADAKRQAEELRGQAEADAAAVYAEAHGKDPQFYKFLRELQSLRTVVDKNTTLVLDTSIAPFHWLKAQEPGPVAARPPAAPARPLSSPALESSP